MNILFWKRSKAESQEQNTWEVAEKPIVTNYHEDYIETKQIIEDILKKLDEIKVLIDEIKNEDNKNV